ncbi:MAG: hypothetical protein AAFV53_41100 [Myxococcota bacterium]
MKPNPSVEKNLIFLMAALVTADATVNPESSSLLSIEKKIAFDQMLEERYAELSFDRRQKRVAKTLRSMPPITGGLSLLKRVERSSQKLTAGLDNDPRQAYGVLRQMLKLAQVERPANEKEQLIMRAMFVSMGLRAVAKLQQAPDGRMVLKRRKSAA